MGESNLPKLCECGERPILTSSTTTCSECGSDHAELVGYVLEVSPEDKVDNLW